MNEQFEGRETYEALQAEYAEQLDEIVPNLSWEQGLQRLREWQVAQARGEIKRLAQMIEGKTDDFRVRVLIDEQLPEVAHLEQAYAVLGFIQQRSEANLRGYSHVLREYGSEEAMRKELEKGRKNTKKAIDDLGVSMVVGETSERSDEIADNLAEDEFTFHHGDIRNYLTAKENILNVGRHSKRISPFINAERRKELLAKGAQAVNIKIERK